MPGFVVSNGARERGTAAGVACTGRRRRNGRTTEKMAGRIPTARPAGIIFQAIAQRVAMRCRACIRARMLATAKIDQCSTL